MRVYRVERVDGVGPYRAGLSLLRGYGTLQHRPGPEDDGIPPLAISDDTRFGFASLEQCGYWFNLWDEREKLEQCGYAVAEYEVSDHLVTQGWHQCAFIKAGATLVRRLPFPPPLFRFHARIAA